MVVQDNPMGAIMRNIIEYPITHEEKVSALKKAIKRSLADAGIGGIEPVALSEVLEEIERRPTAEVASRLP
jgi:hypothetical protein